MILDNEGPAITHMCSLEDRIHAAGVSAPGEGKIRITHTVRNRVKEKKTTVYVVFVIGVFALMEKEI